MRRTVATVVAVVAVSGLSCQTITEEMPTRPETIHVGGAPPIVVVPVPIPSPTGPQPTPRPNPTPPPDDDSGPSIPPFVPDNTAPVAKLGAKVYFVECDGQIVPGSENAKSAKVGCRVHLDCTPKDANNAPTQAKGSPRWTYSNPGIVNIGGHSPYNPVLTVKSAGDMSMYAEVDGVRSNTINMTFN